MYYSRWENGDLTIIQSWVYDNVIIGPEYVVNEDKIKNGKLIEVDDVGASNEFVGGKVENDWIIKIAKLTQPMMIQSFQINLKLENTKELHQQKQEQFFKK